MIKIINLIIKTYSIATLQVTLYKKLEQTEAEI